MRRKYFGDKGGVLAHAKSMVNTPFCKAREVVTQNFLVEAFDD